MILIGEEENCHDLVREAQKLLNQQHFALGLKILGIRSYNNNDTLDSFL
jgi:hypothetical protein